MEWFTPKQKYPQWYEIVQAELVSGEIEEVWLGWDGDKYLWTVYLTDRVYHCDEIKRWTRDKTNEL